MVSADCSGAKANEVLYACVSHENAIFGMQPKVAPCLVPFMNGSSNRPACDCNADLVVDIEARPLQR